MKFRNENWEVTVKVVVGLTFDEGRTSADLTDEELIESLAENLNHRGVQPGDVTEQKLLEVFYDSEEWKSVPCRTSYPDLCDECEAEVRALAYIIEGEGPEDRPHPEEDDARTMAEGSGKLCGGDHCEHYGPYEVVKVSGERREACQFKFDTDAYAYVAKQLRHHPHGLALLALKHGWTEEEMEDDDMLVEVYLDVQGKKGLLGTFEMKKVDS